MQNKLDSARRAGKLLPATMRSGKKAAASSSSSVLLCYTAPRNPSAFQNSDNSSPQNPSATPNPKVSGLQILPASQNSQSSGPRIPSASSNLQSSSSSEDILPTEVESLTKNGPSTSVSS